MRMMHTAILCFILLIAAHVGVFAKDPSLLKQTGNHTSGPSSSMKAAMEANQKSIIIFHKVNPKAPFAKSDMRILSVKVLFVPFLRHTECIMVAD